MFIPIRSNLSAWLLVGWLLWGGLWLMAAQAQSSRAEVEPVVEPSGSLMFIENVGQFADGARFQVWGGQEGMWLAEDGLWVTVLEPSASHQKDARRLGRAPSGPSMPRSLREGSVHATPRQGVHLKLSFVGASANPTIEPFNRLETVVNDFRGHEASKWRSDVPVWGGVRYKGLYPGLDLELTSQGGALIPRLVAHAGADLSVVRWRVEGASAKIGATSREWRLSTAIGEVALPLLHVVGADGMAVDLSSHRPQLEGRTISAPFVSDLSDPKCVAPARCNALAKAMADLTYSSFIGGGGVDRGRALLLDGSGDLIITGRTESSDFPTTAGGYEVTHGGGNDLFVLKLAGDGSALRYATFVGGSGQDEGTALALDQNENIMVTGYTSSSDFPITAGAYQSTHNEGGHDIFVFKLAADGRTLLYSTFVGGNSSESGAALALDGDDHVVITGYTYSPDFPTTNGAYNTTHDGLSDLFVLKLASDGSSLLYSTLVGGMSFDEGTGLALSNTGEAVITGVSESADFPTTSGAYDSSYNGDHEVFVLKLAADGRSLLYSTFVGGAEHEWSNGLALSASGQAVVTGDTASDDFPTTAGAYQTTRHGPRDLFVFALSPDGRSLLYSTLVGGSGFDYGYGLALAEGESAGAIIIGSTESSDFPVTNGAYDTTHDSGGTYGRDGFLLKLSADATTIVYSTFVGGAEDDDNQAVVLPAPDGGNAVITGYTYSADFPTSSGAYDSTHNGDQDLFVLRFDGLSAPTDTPTPTPTALPTSSEPYEPNDSCDQARPIATDGTIQVHTFHNAEDEDWVSFPVAKGVEYIIEGRVPPDSSVDLTLEAYDDCDSKPDDQNPSFSITIRYQLISQIDGHFYLRLRNQNSRRDHASPPLTPPNTRGGILPPIPSISIPGEFPVPPLVLGGARGGLGGASGEPYHLSVRALGEAQHGALIIVAGKYRENDPFQENIHEVTNEVYRIFRAQGHPPDQIYYLAPDTSIDLDNNGIPEVNNLPSSNQLQTAITQWARQYVGAAHALTLFMIDHGGSNKFYLDGTRNDWLTPAQLDGWLTELEEQTGAKVNIIIDASQSGSFIEPTENISKEGRVVISATDASGSSHASPSGLLFSDALLSALAQGMSVKAAFDEATWALEELPDKLGITQEPWLDSDGNGIPNQPSDNSEAERRGFAAPGTFPIDRWAPYIQQAEIRELNGSQGQIWAQVLDDEQETGIEQVWAVVYPPSYQPPTSSEEILSQPSPIPLDRVQTLNDGAEYSGRYSSFNEAGTYRVLIYAQDNARVGARPLMIEQNVQPEKLNHTLFLPLVIRSQ